VNRVGKWAGECIFCCCIYNAYIVIGPKLKNKKAEG
jgi:hypothetical protein